MQPRLRSLKPQAPGSSQRSGWGCPRERLGGLHLPCPGGPELAEHQGAFGSGSIWGKGESPGVACEGFAHLPPHTQLLGPLPGWPTRPPVHGPPHRLPELSCGSHPALAPAAPSKPAPPCTPSLILYTSQAPGSLLHPSNSPVPGPQAPSSAWAQAPHLPLNHWDRLSPASCHLPGPPAHSPSSSQGPRLRAKQTRTLSFLEPLSSGGRPGPRGRT